MKPVLFDSSIYIAALRSPHDGDLLLRRWAGMAPMWLSSVVLEELYAGARPSDHPVLSRLERDFNRANRVAVPSLGDWTQTGKVLARIAAKYGYERIGRGRLTNDALIAMSAARLGIMVLTTNQRDFARLAEFRAFEWQLRKSESPKLD